MKLVGVLMVAMGLLSVAHGSSHNPMSLLLGFLVIMFGFLCVMFDFVKKA